MDKATNGIIICLPGIAGGMAGGGVADGGHEPGPPRKLAKSWQCGTSVIGGAEGGDGRRSRLSKEERPGRPPALACVRGGSAAAHPCGACSHP